MALLLVAVLGALGALYLCAPLPRRQRSGTEAGRVDLLEAESAKGVALDALLDIEEERDLGKLAPEDFRDLEARYEKEALDAIEELDNRRAASRPDDELEQEVAAIRARLSCAACGRLRSKDGRCPSCGDGL